MTIASAFSALRKAGYIARANYKCCQSCALAALPDGTEKYVVYHAQDADDLKVNGECYVAWGGNGAEIVSVLNAHGVKTEWDGSPVRRIKMVRP